jgi:2,4-dienoyl-CoA reductase-like NADH-dependent reductase (Old Yellow Enzyme family)
VTHEGAKTDDVRLGSPLELAGGVRLRNRFMKSAMSEQLGDKRHDPRPGLARVYRRWAEGGLGLAVTGNVMVDRSALGEPGNVVLDEASDLDAFRRWTEAGTAEGTHLWAQLNHPGKQVPSFLAKQPVAPSAIPLGKGLEKAFNTPRALEDEEVLAVVGRFATAARLAKEVGFTGVQIHGAHGYLVNQFLSSRHNQRDDRWGGSLANRMRFALEVYRAIRAEVGEGFPVGIKLNSADFMKGGFSEEESMQVVQALSEARIDLIEISGGTYENPAMVGSAAKESTRKREAYFLAYAEQARQVTQVPLAVTGGFRSAEGMQAALSSGATDLVGLARPLTLAPDLPRRALEDSGYRLDWKAPSTGFKSLDRMMMIGIVWYEQQIQRMAKGLDPKPRLSAWRAVWSTAIGMGGAGLRKRRA